MKKINFKKKQFFFKFVKKIFFKIQQNSPLILLTTQTDFRRSQKLVRLKLLKKLKHYVLQQFFSKIFNFSLFNLKANPLALTAKKNTKHYFFKQPIFTDLLLFINYKISYPLLTQKTPFLQQNKFTSTFAKEYLKKVHVVKEFFHNLNQKDTR